MEQPAAAQRLAAVMEVRREAAPPGHARERRRPYWLAVCSAALVIAASVGAANGTHRHRETGGTRGGDALLRPATRALHSDGEGAAVDASDRSAAARAPSRRDAADAARPAAQRDTVSKALGDVSYSKTGTAPPSVSAAPSYNPTYQPSPAPSVTASPTVEPSYAPTTPGPTGVPTARPSAHPTPLPSYAPTCVEI